MDSRVEVDRICGQIKRAFSGDAWHGDNLSTILDRVDPEHIFDLPYSEGNCIWTLVGHLATWYDVAIKRLDGESYDPPREVDFPNPKNLGKHQWESQRKYLEVQHERFLARVEKMSDEDLDQKVSGVGYPAYILLHGIVQHILYHAGQIALLSKVLEEMED